MSWTSSVGTRSSWPPCPRRRTTPCGDWKPASWTCPSCIYWGADDPSAILEQGQALFQIIRKNNDRTRMLVANRAGHFHYREHPEEFSYNVRSFFEFWRARAEAQA